MAKQWRYIVVPLIALSSYNAKVGAQTTIHIDDDALTGGDGTTWATAFQFLQDALAIAVAGDEVRVAAGTYKPDQAESGTITIGDRMAAFRPVRGVTLLGGFAGLSGGDPDTRDVATYVSELSGDLAGDDGPDFANRLDNSFHVVVVPIGGAGIVLDGLTLVGGYSNEGYPQDRGGAVHVLYGNNSGEVVIRDCTLTSNHALVGGAVDAESGSLTVEGCIFSENRGSSGGALYSATPSTQIRNSTFSRNEGNHGGAIWARGNAVIENCSFIGNKAVCGIYNGNGGALYVYDGTAQVSGCDFLRNQTCNRGGAVYNYDAVVSLTGCRFLANQVIVFSSSTRAAIQNEWNRVIVTNCLLAANDGGISRTGHRSVITNSTIVGNRGRAIHHSATSGTTSPRGTIANSIIWGNETELSGTGIILFVSRSIVKGLSGVPGVIDVDPQFRRNPHDGHDGWSLEDVNNDDYGDLRLRPFSPGIDFGDGDVDVDPYVVGFTGLPATDLGMGLRVVDDPTATNSGTPPPVDVGAYEFQEDCNENGTLDSVELSVPVPPDCNQNLLLDECDIPDDCNENSVQDICEVFDGTVSDCNENEQIDACDIETGRSSDSDVSGVPDECEQALEGFWRFDFSFVSGCYYLEQYLNEVRYFRFDDQSLLLESWAHTYYFDLQRYLKFPYPSTQGPSLNRFVSYGELTADTDRSLMSQSWIPLTREFSMEEMVTVPGGPPVIYESSEQGTFRISGDMNLSGTYMEGNWEFETKTLFCGTFTASRLTGPPPDLPIVIDLELLSLSLSDSVLQRPGQVEVAGRAYRVRGSPLEAQLAIRYYLSADGNLSSDDLAVGEELIGPGIDGTVGLHSAAGPMLSIPACVPGGTTPHILAVLDEASSLPETNEFNNIFAHLVSLSPPPVPAGDSNCDGVLNLVDFAGFPACMGGPWAGFLQPECDVYEFGPVEGVDLVDFAQFQNGMTPSPP